MTARPLVICGAAGTLLRLRAESGCRRLAAEGDGVVWVDLESLQEKLAALHAEGLDTQQRLDLRDGLGRILWGNEPSQPLSSVLVWEQGSGISLPEIENLLAQLSAELQPDKVGTNGRRGVSDRTAFFFGVLVAILPRGLNAIEREEASKTADILKRWAGRGTGEASRKGIPVYLMTECGRLEANGRLWAGERIWPVAVGRLLASLHEHPSRMPGLRAWRTFALSGKVEEPDPVGTATDRSILRVLNYKVERDLAGQDQRSAVRLEEAQYPSRGLVITSKAPGHPREEAAPGQVLPRLKLPDWWRLDAGEGAAGDSTADSRIVRQEAVRTGHGPKAKPGLWDASMKVRGEGFRQQRNAEDEREARSLAGKDSMHYWAWNRIHRDHITVKQVRANGFLCREEAPAASFIELLRKDLQEQFISQKNEADDANIQRADNERKAVVGEALAATRHLRSARQHFVSLGWRAGCALAAALFASALIGSLPVVRPRAMAGLAGVEWALQVGLVAAAGALVASCVMLWLELRAGARAAAAAEGKLTAAERKIADSFQRRMNLVERGLNIRRHTMMFQAATRTADTARRLELMMMQDGIGGVPSSGGDGSKEDLAGTTVIKGYQQATTGLLNPPLTCELLEELLTAAHPNWLEEEATSYLNWWQEHMGSWDPTVVGAIRQEEFMRAYRARWRGFRVQLETRFRQQVVALFMEHKGRLKAEAVQGWVGTGCDAPGLSCMTERAAGLDRWRWVHVLSPSRNLGEVVAAEVQQRAAGDLMKVEVTETATDGWGGVVILVDESDVTLLAPGEARVAGIDDLAAKNAWRVMEGRRSPRFEQVEETLAHA